MFTIYVVNGRYKFQHYGEARSFARQINGTIVIKKSWNPLRVAGAIAKRI